MDIIREDLIRKEYIELQEQDRDDSTSNNDSLEPINPVLTAKAASDVSDLSDDFESEIKRNQAERRKGRKKDSRQNQDK